MLCRFVFLFGAYYFLQITENLRVHLFWRLAILLSAIQSIKREFNLPPQEAELAEDIMHCIEEWMRYLGRLLGYMPGGFLIAPSSQNSS